MGVKSQSAPHPHRSRQRKRRPPKENAHISPMRIEQHPLIAGLGILLSLFMPKEQPVSPPYQFQAPPTLSDIPRYVPAYQHRETQEYVTLSVPRTSRVNPLGYAPQPTEQEPIQPRPYYGRIPTDRYNYKEQKCPHAERLHRQSLRRKLERELW
jgi:hypothetical protein